MNAKAAKPAKKQFFIRFSPRGYALGVNAVLYALTH